MSLSLALRGTSSAPGQVAPHKIRAPCELQLMAPPPRFSLPCFLQIPPKRLIEVIWRVGGGGGLGSTTLFKSLHTPLLPSSHPTWSLHDPSKNEGTRRPMFKGPWSGGVPLMRGAGSADPPEPASAHGAAARLGSARPESGGPKNKATTRRGGSQPSGSLGFWLFLVGLEGGSI